MLTQYSPEVQWARQVLRKCESGQDIPVETLREMKKVIGQWHDDQSLLTAAREDLGREPTGEEYAARKERKRKFKKAFKGL